MGINSSGVPEDMIISPPNTDVGPDGFVKKTGTTDAPSVDVILAENLNELGFIHIICTVQGATVEWSSARPVIKLSRFLQALEGEYLLTVESGENFSGQSENEESDAVQTANREEAEAIEG